MRRTFAFLLCVVAVAVIMRPASALEPLPPSSAVLGLQDVRRYLAPLAACQVDALLTKEHALLVVANAGATVSGIIGLMGLPSDPGVHNLALITLAVATHGEDKEHPERRAWLQPLERLAASAAASIPVNSDQIDSAAQKLPPGACAGLAPIVVPTPDIYAIEEANNKFAATRRAIAAYLTPSMAARLERIATSLQGDASVVSSDSVLAYVTNQLSGVYIPTNQQMALLQYVAIQEALDGQLAHVSTGDAVAANKRIPAYIAALRTIQANMPTPDSIVQNMQG
jgi:hypothetical protein